MKKAQQKRYELLYQQHLSALKRQGKSDNTIDVYSRAVRRITAYFDTCPDKLEVEHFKLYFDSLVKTHSWSTVKTDRCGLQFFYRYVLNKRWDWVEIVKPPKITTLPDILTPNEIAQLISNTQELRYKAFIYTVYSMGLRLSESLNLTIGDIDAQQHRVHIRNGKGRKDRFVTLPESSLWVLRRYWSTHHHPRWLFPRGKTPAEQHISKNRMSTGGTQSAIKAIVDSCRIQKKVSTHTLRHCYGTHLLEVGSSLRAIQTEMGHENLNTTSIYTQFTPTLQQNTLNLLDQMLNRLDIDFESTFPKGDSSWI